jgi:surface antigen
VFGCLALSGCSQTGGSNEATGAQLGSIAGTVVASAVPFGGLAAPAVAGLAIAAPQIGSLIGASIGRDLDERDRQQLAMMTQATLNSGGSQSYRSERTGVRLSTRVAKTRRAEANACRTVEQEVVLADGTKRTDSVRACRGPNGWTSG